MLLKAARAHDARALRSVEAPAKALAPRVLAASEALSRAPNRGSEL